MIPSAEETANPLGPRTALVVAPQLSDSRFVTAVLPARDFHVTVVRGFADARGVVNVRPPDMLITELRLGEYNGLHLVLRGKAARADMAALVLSDLDDSVLQTEAERLGATFIVKPVDEDDLAAAIARTLYRSPEDGGPIRPPFERRSNGERRSISVSPAAERRVGERRRVRFGAAQLELT